MMVDIDSLDPSKTTTIKFKRNYMTDDEFDDLLVG